MNFKITLIKPPRITPVDSFSSTVGLPPIGIAYLSSALKGIGAKVVVIDAHGEALEHHELIAGGALAVTGLTIQEIIKRIDPDTDLISLSCMFSHEWIYTKQIILEIRQVFPNVKIVVGGEHVTAEPNHCFSSVSAIDFCCSGEGEETLKELASLLSVGNLDLVKIKGIYYRSSSGQIIFTGKRDRIIDLDQLPLPDWNAIPLENYFSLSYGLSRHESYKRSLPILASRGCPYECTFCSSEQMWGTAWNARSPHNVFCEIIKWKNEFSVNHFSFVDQTLTTNKKWMNDFCNLIIDSKLIFQFTLPVGTRSEVLTYETLSLMKKAGFDSIQYAPESGSTSTLMRIKKKVDLHKMTQSIRDCVSLQLTTKMTIIFGFPGQTIKEVIESFIFITKMTFVGVHDCYIFPYIPYPGSEIYKKLKDDGLLAKRYDCDVETIWSRSFYTRPTKVSHSEYIPNWLLSVIVLGGMAYFQGLQLLIRPNRVLKAISRLNNNTPQTALELVVYAFYQRHLKN